MKKLLLFCSVLFIAAVLKAQDPEPTPGKHRHFHAGAYYSYSSSTLKINDFSAHSIWYGSDLGTYTAPDSIIDQMNDERKDVIKLNNISVAAGMILTDKPGSHWFVDVTLLFGLSAVNTQTDLDLAKQKQMSAKSDLVNPAFGLTFNARYNLNKHWGVTAIPEIYYTWGNADKISDSIHPMIAHFSNDLKEEFSNAYGRISLMASYSLNQLTISAGPGFFYTLVKKTYTMNRTDPETGYQYTDELKTTLQSHSLIDGCLRADWTFIDQLTFSLQVAVGQNLFINTGLRFNF